MSYCVLPPRKNACHLAEEIFIAANFPAESFRGTKARMLLEQLVVKFAVMHIAFPGGMRIFQGDVLQHLWGGHMCRTWSVPSPCATPVACLVQVYMKCPLGRGSQCQTRPVPCLLLTGLFSKGLRMRIENED